MLPLLTNLTFNCQTSYAIETIDKSSVPSLRSQFENLPTDPYIKGGYRFRRFSRFKVSGDGLERLPHRCFHQSKTYNILLGNVDRDYEELDESLIELDAFKRAVFAFSEFCELCVPSEDIGVHQIRIATSNQQHGSPAPEGIHQDGVGLVGVLCIDRTNIAGGETQLYLDRENGPVFSKILYPGELLVFNDRQFFHFTTLIKPTGEAMGTRDVFVFTCPDMPSEA